MTKILIVEDSTTINNIIKKELVKLHYTISQAFTFYEAKEFLEHKEYDLIILDLHLPDGEGSELIANIQSLSDTKVVILTSSQDNDLREELFQFGILDYIIKDSNLLYSIKEIIKIINTIQVKNRERILIIDDSYFICKQIKIILEPRNYDIDFSLTAKDGLIQLKTNNYDLLILDMELPDIHGIKVLNLIRRDVNLLHLPIMVLSGTTTPAIIRDVLKNGANDILKKPFIFEEFILKVDLWIDYFKKEQLIQEKNDELNFINNNLENIIHDEIQKSREKDKIMFQQSRQAQMGEMIAMIAHQWRQPLNIIGTASSIINNRVNRGKLDAKLSLELTSKIAENIEYLSTTINDFRDFFRPEKEMQITNFHTILEKALSLVESSLTSHQIKLSVKNRSITEFTTYENELVQVILNLLKNAEDVLTYKKIKEPTLTIEINDFFITISDNGGGIDEDVIEEIFDPYFSTKIEKEGTGLGLYMSKVIVEEHCNGVLDVKNGKDGAIFRITLKDNA